MTVARTARPPSCPSGCARSSHSRAGAPQAAADDDDGSDDENDADQEAADIKAAFQTDEADFSSGVDDLMGDLFAFQKVQDIVDWGVLGSGFTRHAAGSATAGPPFGLVEPMIARVASA